MDLAAIVFSDTYGTELNNLVLRRTLAAIPFGARYRLIDFTLSNLVNSGIRNIGLVVKQNYQSLLGHIQSGREWDLDRKNGGLQILPPFSTEGNTEKVYKNRLEGLMANISYLRRLEEEYVIITGCDHVYNVNYSLAFDFHIQSGARITCLYANKPINPEDGRNLSWMTVTEAGDVTEILTSQDRPFPGAKLSLNTYIMKRRDLLEILNETYRSRHESFRHDIVDAMVKEGGGQVRAVGTDERILFVNTVPGYLKSSLLLLDPDIRESLFRNEERPVITKVKDSPPTRYGPEARVSNSLIADGAIIDGTVRNSVIFRGVKIGSDAVVENCVVMQDTTVSDGVRLNYAILDKEVFIEPGRLLSGYLTRPFMVERNSRI